MDKIEAQAEADKLRRAALDLLSEAGQLSERPGGIKTADFAVVAAQSQVYATLALALETRAASLAGDLVPLVVAPGQCEADHGGIACILKSGHAGRHEAGNGMAWVSWDLAGVSEREA